MAGFTPREAVTPRLLVLAAATTIVLVVSLAVTALSFTPQLWLPFIIGNLLVGLIYAMLGALAGAAATGVAWTVALVLTVLAVLSRVVGIAPGRPAADADYSASGVLTRLNTVLRRRRHRVAIAAAVVAVAGAVALAHSCMADDHMGNGMVMCLAVMETAAFVVLRSAGSAAAIVRRPVLDLPIPPQPDAQPPTPPVPRLARAGPPAVQVFRL